MDSKNISLTYERLLRGLLIFLIIFIPYREALSLFISSKVKLIPDIMILLLLVLYVVKNNFKIKLNLTDICYGVFLIMAFISTILVNKVGIKPYIIQCRSIFIYYILYFLLRNSNLNAKFYKVFSIVISYNTIILVFLAIIEKIANKTILFPSAWSNSIFYADNFLRAYGMFNNPNTFGAYLLFSIIIMVYLEKFMNIKGNRVFYVFSIVGIILTASRSSMISLGAFIIASIFLFNTSEMLKKFAFNVACSIIIVFAVNNLNSLYIDSIVNNPSKSQVNLNKGNSAIDRLNELSNPAIIAKSKTDGRIFSITKGMEIFKNNPILGTGFGTYGDAASLIISPKQYEAYGISEDFYADNEYIKVLVETGIIGTIVYMIFLISIMNNYRKSYFKLVVCVILGFLGMFYNIFEVQILSFMFWVVLTLPEDKINA